MKKMNIKMVSDEMLENVTGGTMDETLRDVNVLNARDSKGKLSVPVLKTMYLECGIIPYFYFDDETPNVYMMKTVIDNQEQKVRIDGDAALAYVKAQLNK